MIDVTVPSLIADCTKGQTRFTLDAVTVQDAIDCLLSTYPLLRTHLYTEKGELRQHVLIFYNDDSIAWMDTLDIPLRQGDRLTVFQAVSGG